MALCYAARLVRKRCRQCPWQKLDEEKQKEKCAGGDHCQTMSGEHMLAPPSVTHPRGIC